MLLCRTLKAAFKLNNHALTLGSFMVTSVATVVLTVVNTWLSW
jgi:hypothetical protein